VIRDPSDSSISITFDEIEGCIVDVDATLDQLRHAIASLSATLLEEHPEDLTDDERQLLSAAMAMLMQPLMDDLN